MSKLDEPWYLALTDSPEEAKALQNMAAINSPGGLTDAFDPSGGPQ